MKCPHCDTAINLDTEESGTWLTDDFKETKMGYDVAFGHCPECDELIVSLRRGIAKQAKGYDYYELDDVTSEEIIYPKFTNRKVETEVPERYKRDFIEACSVLTLSAKASAALSRRILQDVLIEKFSIKHRSLDKQIEEFITRTDVPSYLSQAVDAIRSIGNFAAHPLKDTNTGEIIEVEPGEAEWLLDVLEILFDFTFVQPKRLEEKKEALNKKLKSAGKPEMKG